ncbi:GSDH family dehydrogenase [Oleiphilus messinensis]|uniref:GSDH family dehydrogenase n=1 Tax=Oleiphilus messinensis TaxID=141451 RepID=A0A1Y0I9M1_9GAMM|nr:PQQ-dependent sugar dehydrogenase [Oleiphilus messinensis]ARU57222.1 GSDH family dehydrogenase [Oleiphilus messinensis]
MYHSPIQNSATFSYKLCHLPLILGALMSGQSIADSISTSFEFSGDSSGFVLGSTPETLSFTGGQAQSIGIFSLYHSGSNAWMIAPGETGSILFETAPETLKFFIRDQSSNTGGELEIRDEDDNLVLQVTATANQWTEIHLTDEDSTNIREVILRNTGNNGFAVLDDLTYTAQVNTPSPDGEPLSNPIPMSIPMGMQPLRLEPLSTNLIAPNHGTFAPGWPEHLIVTDQTGQIWAVHTTQGTSELLLDLSDSLVTLGVAGNNSFDERGLLGLAFHPEFQTNGKLYTYTSEPATQTSDFALSGATANHQSIISEWTITDPMTPASVINPDSKQPLLRIDQPQFNHDGGAIAFGPDNMLYIALGDGGQADDQGDGHSSLGNGQDKTTPLGSILRIDVDGSNGRNGNYGIPTDNPFLDDRDALDEIFAYGLRNPFRMSFDRLTGELIAADVGQNDIEEINVIQSGGNYGWNLREGSFQFNPNDTDPGFVSPVTTPNENLINPIAEYDHDEGIAIIGGFVNRGNDAETLSGRYLFGDYLGRMFHLTEFNTINEVQIENRPAGLNERILGFGEDINGTLYLMTNTTGTPFGSTGRIYKLANAITDGSYEQLVQLIYIAFYGRPADPAGLSFWASELANNQGDLTAIIEFFGSSVEFTERFGQFDSTALINNLFSQIFSREADSGGLAFYDELFTSGQLSLQQISLDILNGAQGNDAQIIANKLSVAVYFTNAVETGSLSYDSENISVIVDIMNAVTDNPQSGIDAINGSTAF